MFLVFKKNLKEDCSFCPVLGIVVLLLNLQ